MLLTKDAVQQMSEDALCKEVLIPLLKAMNFHDVTFVHGGSAEQGKDIVCWKEDELGSRQNLAIVAKAIKVSGKAKVAKGTTGEIVTQIQQCFGEPFLDPITAEPQPVHICWIVTNQEIGKEGEKAIRSALMPNTLERNIKFVCGDQLWNLVEKYMPFAGIWEKLGDVGKTLSQLDSHYQPKVTLLPDSNIHFELVEKFPGASAEKPIQIATKFQFPPTPEGKAAFEALQRHFQTGEPVDLPLQYIQTLQLPDFISSFVNIDELRSGVLHMGEAVSSPHIFVKVRIVCEDGDKAEIDYVDLSTKYSGNQEITLVNREGGNPYDIQLNISFDKHWANITLKPKTSDNENVYHLFQIYHIQRCLSKPATLYLINRQNDLVVFSQVTQGLTIPIEDGLIDELSDLVTIQKRVKKPINLPARNFSEDEIHSIARLRSILHKPCWSTTWDFLDIEITPDGIETFLETANQSEDLFFRVTSVETEELFDVEIPLGEVEITYHHAKIENLDDIKQLPSAEGNLPIKIRVVPNGINSEAKIKYLEWIDIPQQE